MRRGGARPGPVRPGGTYRAAVRPRPVSPAIGVSAIRVAAVRVSAIRVSAVRAARGAAARSRPLRSAVAGTAIRRPTRREPAGLTRLTRLARVGPPWLTRPRRTRRRLTRMARRLPVVVFVEMHRSAWPRPIVILGCDGIILVRRVGSRTVATAIALASRRTVRVTAEASVATFHQMPPGPRCPAVTRDACPYPLSVGR
jgi:hypothetical protein